MSGRLTGDDIARLENAMRVYDRPPVDLDDQYRQRIAELDFHSCAGTALSGPSVGLHLRIDPQSVAKPANSARDLFAEKSGLTVVRRQFRQSRKWRMQFAGPMHPGL